MYVALYSFMAFGLASFGEKAQTHNTYEFHKSFIAEFKFEGG